MENDIFKLKVNTGTGGYSYIDRIEELLLDVECEYGKEIRNKVEKWALLSKKNDHFNFKRLLIINLGD